MSPDDPAQSDATVAPIVVPIEDVLDLHGFRPRDVLDVVDAYLDAALEKGLRDLRLIHGRGKGVQRAQIRRMLEGDPRVARFEEAPPGRGGWGATLVWLHAPEDAGSQPADPPEAEPDRRKPAHRTEPN